MKYSIVVLLLLVSLCSYSQKDKIHLQRGDTIALADLLSQVEQIYNVKFSYSSNLIADKTINLSSINTSLDEILFEISVTAAIQFEKINDKYIYITAGTRENISEVVISSYLTRGITKNKNGNYIINPKKLDLLPGLTETDILESIQQLPGVISIDETATGLSVRGGFTDQNRIIWDNINIYHSGHLYGMVSVFNPNIAQEINFYNKGSNVRYGERIASVIDIKTGSTIAKNTVFQAGANGISSDFLLEIPIINNKLSLQTSFRRSYEELFETITFNKYEEKAFQNTIIDDESFHFKDYNLKINYHPNKNNRIAASLIHIDNDLINNYHNLEQNTIYVDMLDTENQGYNIQWDKIWNSNLSQKTSFSFSNYTLDYQLNTKYNTGDDSEFLKQNSIYDNQLFTEFKYTVNKNKIIEFGYQFIRKDVRFLFKEIKDIIYILDRDDSRIDHYAVFAAYTYHNEHNLNIYAGIRGNYYNYLKKLKPEPRIVINKELNDKFTIQITGEVKNQIISQIDESILSNLSLENKIWRLADGEDYPIINAFQTSTGLIYKTNNWTADIDFFYKKSNGISALSLGFLNPTDNTVHKGEQKASGLDFYLKKDFKHISAWLSYSFIDVKNKYNSINNGKYFTANTQIKHSLSTTITFKKNQFQMAASWRIHSGKPLTDLDIDNDGNPYFDGINTKVLPVYHRLDFSTTYKFFLSKKHRSRAKVGLSIRNLYNNKNLISTEFTGYNSIDDPIKITNRYSVGFTPNMMFRLFF